VARVGLFLLVVSWVTDRTSCTRCSRVAEEGVDHVCVGDHVSFFVGAGSDGLITATSLLTAQAQLPVYVGSICCRCAPGPVARQLATIAQLAPGRLTVQDALIVPAPSPRKPLIIGGRSDAAVSRAARLSERRPHPRTHHRHSRAHLLGRARRHRRALV
jgi:alkanesulfonate monooxygenase SsuD/methylene tetrahydromethanopterin reductase-like flavin-dependent oxidoreductase (luciferase family)